MERTLLLLALIFPAACRRADAPAPPLQVTTAQFRSLAWLEGRWRGSDGAGLVFFEGYRLQDDSTIVGYTFGDSSLAPPIDSGLIELRGGTIETGSGGPRWAVTRLDETSVHFAPLRGASNEFTWRREGPHAWTALLAFRDSAGTSERTYRMERWPRPGP